VADGGEKFFAGDGGGAAFHDDQATGNISDVRGFQGRSAASEGDGVSGENSVAGAGDVDGLIAAVDRDLCEAAFGFEERHAVAAAGDEKGAEFHFGERSGAGAREFGKILANGDVMQGFEFGFVRRGGGDACFGVGVKIVARVERDDRSVFLFGHGFTNQSGRSDAEAVIGHGQRTCGTKFRAQLCVQLFVNRIGQRRLWLAVDAKNLLADGVRPAGKEAGFGRSRPAFYTEEAGEIDAFAAEIVDQRVARGIVADGADGEHPRAEGGKIVGSIGATAGNELRFAMAKNQDGRFARDARNFAELEFVGNKIAEENDGFRREFIDVVGEGHEIDGRRQCVLLGGALHFVGLKIQ
jgi:hypothetical protein